MIDSEKPQEFLHRIMDFAVSQGAADIHFKANQPPIFQIRDKIHRVEGCSVLKNTDLEEIINSITKENQRNFLKDNLELDFSYQHGDSRFRVNVGFEKEGMYSTLRLIPKQIPDIYQIGFPNEVWKKIIALKRGLVLVTGVTGSGKTTTSASMIQEINKNYYKNIITIEDPIEYLHSQINSVVHQRELGLHTKSFYNGVKWALRQAPHVIYVGEIRDPETAREVLNAAETGHLVISTEHSRDTTGAIVRFIDLFSAEEKDNIRASLASNIEYILAQQLIPGHGNKRVLAMEIMQATYGIRSLIREGKFHQFSNQITSGRKDNPDMITMDSRLVELYRSGLVPDKETILQYCLDPKNTESMLSKS